MKGISFKILIDLDYSIDHIDFIKIYEHKFFIKNGPRNYCIGE